MHPYASRRDRLPTVLHENQLDGLVVFKPVNVTYLTGFSGEASHLLVGKDQTILVSDGRFTEQIAQECPGLETYIRPPAQPIWDATAQTLGKLSWKNVGFEAAHVSVADFEGLREKLATVNWKSCVGVVETLRMKKDAAELAEIQQAIAIAERAFERLRQSLRPEDDERQVSHRLERFMREEGAKTASFPTIVGVSERAALPHAPLSKKQLGQGEMVLIDWGADGGFYKSDLTRVFATRSISPQLRQVHAAVLNAQQRAISAIRPGVKAQDVDAVARAALEEAGLADKFTHGLGHGIGLEIHEGPWFRPNSEIVLEAGMVTTVEPGVYITGWGGVRIEDDVLITENGCDVLTHVSRDLTALFA
jgi:Xaa-Pro aminopeptidase